MNKIINGRKYNTETAVLVCEEHCYNYGNWQSTHELYKKKTGEFFIYHRFNPNDVWTPANYIEPVSEETALKFAQEIMNGDDYEKFFGEVEE